MSSKRQGDYKRCCYDRNLGTLMRKSKNGDSFIVGAIMSADSIAPRATVSVLRMRIGKLVRTARIVEIAMLGAEEDGKPGFQARG